MLITNNREHVRYLFYHVAGVPKSVKFGPLEAIDISDLTSTEQIIYNPLEYRLKYSNETFDTNFELDFTTSSTPTSTNSTVQAWLDKIALDGYSYPTQAKVDVYTAAFDYADAQSLTSQFQLLCCFNVNSRDVMKIPFIHSGGATRRLEEVVYQGDGLTFYANEGFTSSDAGNVNIGYFRTNWIESVDATTSMLNNTSIGGYVLDHTSNTSTNMGGSLASDFSSGTQLIPKYSPASTTAVIIQSLVTILSPTTNFVGDGHIYATLYSDTLTLYIDGVSKGTTSSPPDGLSDMEDCIGTIEVEGVPADYSAEYKLSVYYRTVGNIDQAKLNTFIGMLMS